MADRVTVNLNARAKKAVDELVADGYSKTDAVNRALNAYQQLGLHKGTEVYVDVDGEKVKVIITG